MNKRHVDEALKTLGGMREIVEAEMLEQGTYVTEDVVDESKSGAICGGRRYCAIGALGVAYGFKPYTGETDRWDYPIPTQEWNLFVMWGSRYSFVGAHPALELALTMLDEVADEHMDRYGIQRTDTCCSSIEQLFESSSRYANTKRGRQSLVRLIERARERITERAAAGEL